MLDVISEAYSPLKMITVSPGFFDTLGYYSIIGMLAPLLIPAYIWAGWKAETAPRLFFAVMVVFGVTLLLTQYRLNYFGSFAVITGWAVLLTDRFPALRSRQLLVAVTGCVLVFLSAIPGFMYIIGDRYSLGWDDRYQESLPLFQALKEACAENPGIVLVDNDFGHILRYSAECSVIANNFLMTPQHEDKIREMYAYLKMTPEELLENKPEDMRYVFARLANYLTVNEDGETVVVPREELEEYNLRLTYDLNTRQDLPDRYRLIAILPLINEEPVVTRTRLYEILPE